MQPTPDPAHSAPEDTARSPLRWAFFAVTSAGVLMISLDNSILFTALPALSEQLHATPLEQLWIINAYAIVMAGLLLGTGSLGDRVGHRRMFIVGLSIFGAASLVAALAPSAWLLVAARAFLGLGAAVMMPATLALIQLTFDDEVERNTAIGIWGSVAVVGAAAAPTVGGLLLQHFWWGSVFLINVPVVIIALIGAFWLAPPNAPNPQKHWDALSSLLVLVTLASLVLAIKSFASTHRSTALIACALAVFFSGAWLFTRRQRSLEDPLLTFDIFRSRIFSGGTLGAAGAMFGLSGMELLTTQKLQFIDGFSPLQAGLCISAVAISAFPMSALGGAYLHKVGFLPLIGGGFAVMALGAAIGCSAVRLEPFGAFLAGLILVGVGAGLVMSVSSTAIIGSAPTSRSGMAAGVEEVSYEFGTLLSIAITGSLLPVFFTAFLPAGAPGLDALGAAPAPAATAAAYNQAYFVVIASLAVCLLLCALGSAWCFRDNPKSAEAHLRKERELNAAQ